MKFSEWSLVQYRVDDSEKLAVGVSVRGSIVQGPPGTEGLSLMEVLGRWDSLAPLLQEWVPTPSDVIAEARVAPPLTYPGKVLCAGANYWDHCAEMGVEPPDELGDPFFFLKPPTTTVTGPGDPVPLPSYPGARVDWEAELAVVIGRAWPQPLARSGPRSRGRLPGSERHLGQRPAHRPQAGRQTLHLRLGRPQGTGRLLPARPGNRARLADPRPAEPADPVECQRCGEAGLLDGADDGPDSRSGRGGQPPHPTRARRCHPHRHTGRLSERRAGSS